MLDKGYILRGIDEDLVLRDIAKEEYMSPARRGQRHRGRNNLSNGKNRRDMNIEKIISEIYFPYETITLIAFRNDYCYIPAGRHYLVYYGYYGSNSVWADRSEIKKIEDKIGDKLFRFPDKEEWINLDKLNWFSGCMDRITKTKEYGGSINIDGLESHLDHKDYVALMEVAPSKSKGIRYI